MNERIINNPVAFLQIKPKKYVGFILLIFLLLIVYSLNQEVKNTITLQGIVVKEKEYQIFLYVPYNEVSKIIGKNTLLIDEIETAYKVIKITDDIKIIGNQNIQEVIIAIKLKREYQINNLLLETKIIISKEKLYYQLWKNLIGRE